jgi:hypothetical protein
MVAQISRAACRLGEQKMSSDPVCLLQWLKPGDFREVDAAWKAFSKSLNITLNVVSSKNEAIAAISEWLKGNSNSQFLYIGSHGIKDAAENYLGLGADGDDFLTWDELRALLMRARLRPVLWLGACGSSAVADAWSPIAGIRGPAAWITSFPDPVMPRACLSMLTQSLGDTSTAKIVFLDQELPRLRKQLHPVAVEQFYPAERADGVHAYVSVDRFEAETGVDFATYLRSER